MDTLEYLVALRGGAAAAAEVRGLAGEFDKLAVSQGRASKAGAEGAASSGKMGGAIGLLGKGVAAAAVSLVAIGVEATRMSANFNHEMLKIRTDAGATTAELNRMKTGVLQLASSGASMGQGPMSLAQGLYHLESLGIRGGKALDALKLASQEAAISGASLEQTTSALGAAMYVNIKGTGNLTQLMGILNATVGAGNMRFQDLVDALGTGLLPAAKVAGLSIQDVGASIAVLSDAGYKGASAAAQLGTALHFMYAPTAKASSALKSIGLSSTSLAMDMHKPQGMLVALTDLRNHLAGLSDVAKAQVLNAIFPGGRGRVLLTELTLLDRLKIKYDQINRTAGGFSGAVAMQRKDPLTQLKTAEAGLQANMIRLGNVVGPAVMPALAQIVKFASGVVSALTTIPGAIQSVIGWFDTLNGASAKQTRAPGQKGMMMNQLPITPPTGGLADFVRTVEKTYNTISKVISTVAKAIGKAISEVGATAHKVFGGSFGKDLSTIGKAVLVVGGIFAKVFGWFATEILPGLVMGVRGFLTTVRGMVSIISGLLTGNFTKVWNGIKDVIGGALRTGASIMLTIFKPAIDAIVTAATWLWQNVLKPVADFLVGAFKTALVVVSGIFVAMTAPITAVVALITTLFGGLSSIGNWVAGAGQSVLNFFSSLVGAAQNTTSLTAAVSPTANTTLTGTPKTSTGSLSGPGATPKVTHNIMRRASTAVAATGVKQQVGSSWLHGDIVLKVSGRDLLRVHSRELQKSMARG